MELYSNKLSFKQVQDGLNRYSRFKDIQVIVDMVWKYCCCATTTTSNYFDKNKMRISEGLLREVVDFLIIFTTSPRSAQLQVGIESYDDFSKLIHETDSLKIKCIS